MTLVKVDSKTFWQVVWNTKQSCRQCRQTKHTWLCAGISLVRSVLQTR